MSAKLNKKAKLRATAKLKAAPSVPADKKYWRVGKKTIKRRMA